MCVCACLFISGLICCLYRHKLRINPIWLHEISKNNWEILWYSSISYWEDDDATVTFAAREKLMKLISNYITILYHNSKWSITLALWWICVRWNAVYISAIDFWKKKNNSWEEKLNYLVPRHHSWNFWWIVFENLRHTHPPIHHDPVVIMDPNEHHSNHEPLLPFYLN